MRTIAAVVLALEASVVMVFAIAVVVQFSSGPGLAVAITPVIFSSLLVGVAFIFWIDRHTRFISNRPWSYVLVSIVVLANLALSTGFFLATMASRDEGYVLFRLAVTLMMALPLVFVACVSLLAARPQSIVVKSELTQPS